MCHFIIVLLIYEAAKNKSYLSCLCFHYSNCNLRVHTRLVCNYYCVSICISRCIVLYRKNKLGKKQNFKLINSGGIRSTWGHNFAWAHRMDRMTFRNLDSRLWIKVIALWSFPMFVWGSHAFAMFSMINGEYPLGMCTYYADDLYPICSKLEYRLSACIVWLYYASSSIIWWFFG